MASEPLSKTVIPKSAPVVWLFLGVFAFMSIGTAMITTFVAHITIFPWAPRPIRSPLETSSLLPLIFWILMFMGQLSIVAIIVRFLRSSQPALVLDKDGLKYWVGIIKVESVPWKNIERIELAQDRLTKKITGRFNPDICLTLSVYTRTNPGKQTIFERLNQWNGTGDKLILNPCLINNKREIYDLMQTYLVASKSELTLFN
jgi:hypothetical protein